MTKHLSWADAKSTKDCWRPRSLRARLGFWIEHHVRWHCKLGVHSWPPEFRAADPWVWYCGNCKMEYPPRPETRPIQRDVPTGMRIESWEAPPDVPRDEWTDMGGNKI